MKKLIVCLVLVFSLVFFASVLADEPSAITVGNGTLKIGGILQVGAKAYIDKEYGDHTFSLTRARLLFWGTMVPDKVKYFIQTDGVGSPFVLDVKLQYFYIPKTEITVGRFLPNFTHYMPSSTAKLDLISYPLMVYKYAMWRQVGAQVTTKTDYVDFTAGIFNGYPPTNNWTDNNDYKDFLGRVDIKADKGLRFGSYFWLGKTPSTTSKTETTGWYYYDTQGDSHYVSVTNVIATYEKDTKLHRIGGFLLLSYEGLTFNTEYISGSTNSLYAASDSVKTTKNQGFYLHAGYKVSPHLELLARYDYYDPDTDTKNDYEYWFTGGLNYFIKGYNAMLGLNYLHKGEETTTIDNDELLAQFQILF